MRPQPTLLHFPAGGVVRSMAYQNQQPYTAPDALNVWPEDTLLGRQRGGQRPGLSIGFTGLTTTPFQGLAVYRFPSATKTFSEFLVGAQNQTIVYDSSGTLSLRTAGTASSIRNGVINMRAIRQFMVVADHSYNAEESSSAVLAYGSNGTIASSTQFDSATYSDWTALGENASTIQYDFQLVIVSGTDVTPGCYAITTANTTELVLANSPCIAPATTGSSIVFRIERCPKYLSGGSGNTTTGGTYLNKLIQTNISTYGFVPSGNPLCELYRDRLVFAGQIDNPWVWYMSAVGDIFDWNYAGTGVGRAISGATQNQKAGQLGDPIKMLAAYSDEAMLIGCTNSMHIMRGDPANRGGVDLITDHIGIVGQSAWCRTTDQSICWLSQDGMYQMVGGAEGRILAVSRDKIPQELLNLNTGTYRVCLQWDHQNNGIYVFVTHKTSGVGTGHWFLDWTHKGWWPMSFHTDCEPWATTVAPLYAGANKTPVVLGCKDGELRQFDDSRDTDQLSASNNNITSYVDIGPFPIADATGHSEGYINEIEGAPAANSGDIDWSIRTGNTPEQAYNASVPTSGHCFGEWNTTGLNYKSRPHKKGQSAVVRIKNGENARWAIEHIKVTRQRAGTRKRTGS